ncbi:MAG: tRNA (adenosine(37)-N6)-threonylcarbamoyltransferase complex ATPase subunit type 1 TsaE [Gemmatimonadota bacterium]
MSGSILDERGVSALAEQLAAELPTGSVLWLEGELGAGKTTFARAFIRARTGSGGGTSPTYGLVHRHAGPRGDTLHLDCYRLRAPEDAADLDWEGAAEADILLIEWPDRAGSWAPPPDRRVQLHHQGEDTRRIEVLS